MSRPLSRKKLSTAYPVSETISIRTPYLKQNMKKTRTGIQDDLEHGRSDITVEGHSVLCKMNSAPYYISPYIL